MGFGPIHSALQIIGYSQPHQVVLLEAQNLYTHWTTSGVFIEDEVPLDQQSMHALQLLQAYHNAYLIATDDRTDFYLGWHLWMHVTYKDLMAFDFLSKTRAKLSDDFDREHHLGKYKAKQKVDFKTKKVEHETEEDEEKQEDNSSHQTDNGAKTRGNKSVLKGIPQDPNTFKDLK